jgi:hypothetical protein
LEVGQEVVEQFPMSHQSCAPQLPLLHILAATILFADKRVFKFTPQRTTDYPNGSGQYPNCAPYVRIREKSADLEYSSGQNNPLDIQFCALGRLYKLAYSPFTGKLNAHYQPLFE